MTNERQGNNTSSTYSGIFFYPGEIALARECAALERNVINPHVNLNTAAVQELIGLRVYGIVTRYANTGKIEALRSSLRTGNEHLKRIIGNNPQRTVIISLSQDCTQEDLKDLMFIKAEGNSVLHGVYNTSDSTKQK